MSEEVRRQLLGFLVRNYGDLRRRLVRSLRSPELADDALHDTWLRLRRLENQSLVLNPRAFLLRMSVNIAINSLRRSSSHVARSEVEALLEVADPSPQPEQSASARAEMDRVLERIRHMPQRRRDVLLMVRWEGLPQNEVARRLGISLRTVELELQRANQGLAALSGAEE